MLFAYKDLQFYSQVCVSLANVLFQVNARKANGGLRLFVILLKLSFYVYGWIFMFDICHIIRKSCIVIKFLDHTKMLLTRLSLNILMKFEWSHKCVVY